MIIGVLQLELHFLSPQSLKEKRVLLKSLIDRIKNKFNVAVAEIDGMDLWQSSTLAIAAVAGEKKRANQILDWVLEFVHSERSLEIARHRLELM